MAVLTAANAVGRRLSGAPAAPSACIPAATPALSPPGNPGCGLRPGGCLCNAGRCRPCRSGARAAVPRAWRDARGRGGAAAGAGAVGGGAAAVAGAGLGAAAGLSAAGADAVAGLAGAGAAAGFDAGGCAVAGADGAGTAAAGGGADGAGCVAAGGGAGAAVAAGGGAAGAAGAIAVTAARQPADSRGVFFCRHSSASLPPRGTPEHSERKSERHEERMASCWAPVGWAKAGVAIRAVPIASSIAACFIDPLRMQFWRSLVPRAHLSLAKNDPMSISRKPGPFRRVWVQGASPCRWKQARSND